MQIKQLHFTSIESTNTWAKKNIQEFDREGLTLVLADEQTAGRGRFTRSWVSPKGCNLYGSYVFFSKKIDDITFRVPQLLALIASETAQRFVPEVQLKWPNDLVIGEKKVGGILCEVQEVEDGVAVITGIGLNINMSKEDLALIDRPATSLKEALGRSLDREDLIETLTAHFAKALHQLLREGFTPFFERFNTRMIHRCGDFLRFHDFLQIIEGYFERIENDGSLVMRLEDGSLKRVFSGELV